MVSELVKEVFNDWYSELQSQEENEKNILGIAEQSSKIKKRCIHCVTIYCLKTPKVLGFYSVYIQELNDRIADLSNDNNYYKLTLNLVDVYEDPHCSHVPINVNIFENMDEFRYHPIDINNTIIEWASNYTRSMNFNISFVMRSAMINRETNRLGIKIDIYSKDSFIIMFMNVLGDSINNLKLDLLRMYPGYDFYINVYEAFTAMI